MFQPGYFQRAGRYSLERVPTLQLSLSRISAKRKNRSLQRYALPANPPHEVLRFVIICTYRQLPICVNIFLSKIQGTICLTTQIPWHRSRVPVPALYSVAANLPFRTIAYLVLRGMIATLDRPARLPSLIRIFVAVADASTRQRSEERIPQRMFVRLSLPDGASFEMAQTIDISRHGARVATKRFWAPNQHLLLRALRGNLSAYARVVRCESLAENSYCLGLELYNPVGDWAGASRS